MKINNGFPQKSTQELLDDPAKSQVAALTLFRLSLKALIRQGQTCNKKSSTVHMVFTSASRVLCSAPSQAVLFLAPLHLKTKRGQSLEHSSATE